MRNVYLGHPFDLDVAEESLDLFAEEVQDSQEHPMPPNSFSSLGCECGLSTFFCYGCGLDVVAEAEQFRAADADPSNMTAALAWAREKMDSTDEADQKVGEVLRAAFGFRRDS